MRISELSQKTGVSLRSLRYYEEKGLITPTRKENGYREYSDSDVQWVETIQLFLSIGATTEELSTYLKCQATHESLCLNPATVIEFYERKLQSIQEQMKILQKAELCNDIKVVLILMLKKHITPSENVDGVKIKLFNFLCNY